MLNEEKGQDGFPANRNEKTLESKTIEKDNVKTNPPVNSGNVYGADPDELSANNKQDLTMQDLTP